MSLNETGRRSPQTMTHWNVVELEFEIVDGKKKLIGEKTLGTTVTKELETICKTPTFKRRQAQCDISRMIEQHLSNSVPDQVYCLNF